MPEYHLLYIMEDDLLLQMCLVVSWYTDNPLNEIIKY